MFMYLCLYCVVFSAIYILLIFLLIYFVFFFFCLQQKQDIFSEFSTNLTLSPIHKQTKTHCCNTPKVSIPEKTIQNSIAKKEIPSKKKVTDIQESHIDSSTDDVKTKHICNCCILGENKKNNDNLEFLYAFVSVNVKDNILPQSLMKGKIYVKFINHISDSPLFHSY